MAEGRYRVIELPGRLVAAYGDEELLADGYVPDGPGPFPGFVLVHGGAFTKGSRASFRSWGRFLASHGYVALSTDYRLASPARTTFPECIWDVKAAIQHVRGSAAELHLDAARIGVMGDSAGGYLAAMAALTAREARSDVPVAGPFHEASSDVEVVVAIAGLYDLVAAWEHDRRIRPLDYQPLELFLGGPPTELRARYLEASPLTHVTSQSAARTSWLISWGTEDEIVPPEPHSMALARQLAQAGALVRLDPIPGAPHFWEMETAADAPGSYNAHLAGRVLGFLGTWCGW